MTGDGRFRAVHAPSEAVAQVEACFVWSPDDAERIRAWTERVGEDREVVVLGRRQLVLYEGLHDEWRAYPYPCWVVAYPCGPRGQFVDFETETPEGFASHWVAM